MPVKADKRRPHVALEFGTVNAAFTGEGADAGREIADILRQVAVDVENGRSSGLIFDVNGGQVGSWRWRR